MMRAAFIEELGGPEVIRVTEVPIPEPGPGEARVRVLAAGLNYSDIALREGRYVGTTPLPLRLGRELCGVVDCLGPDAAGPAPGTRVVGIVPCGAFADFVVAHSEAFTPCPDAIPDTQAAGIVLQGLTASLALTEAAGVTSSDTVLVHAAAGGVGALAVQMARRIGARVIGTASTPEKCAFAGALGAEVVSYADGSDWVREVLALTAGRGADVILECIGGDVFVQSFNEALAPFGRMVVYGIAGGRLARVRNSEVIPANKRLVGFYLGAYLSERTELVARTLAHLLELVSSGALRVHVGGTFALDRVADAYDLMQSRRSMGKVVIVP